MRSFTTLVPQLVKREQELHDISSLIIAFAQSFRIAAESNHWTDLRYIYSKCIRVMVETSGRCRSCCNLYESRHNTINMAMQVYFRFIHARMPSHRYCRYTMSLSQRVLHFLSCCSSHTEGPAILAVRFYQMGVHIYSYSEHSLTRLFVHMHRKKEITAKIASVNRLWNFQGSKFNGKFCHHPRGTSDNGRLAL